MNQATVVLEVGYWAAVTLKAEAAPLRGYCGRVEAVGDRGVRLRLIDWSTGQATGWDLFVPWESVTSALVATPDHDLTAFAQAATDWQQLLHPPEAMAAGE